MSPYYQSSKVIITVAPKKLLAKFMSMIRIKAFSHQSWPKNYHRYLIEKISRVFFKMYNTLVHLFGGKKYADGP